MLSPGDFPGDHVEIVISDSFTNGPIKFYRRFIRCFNRFMPAVCCNVSLPYLHSLHLPFPMSARAVIVVKVHFVICAENAALNHPKLPAVFFAVQAVFTCFLHCFHSPLSSALFVPSYTVCACPTRY